MLKIFSITGHVVKQFTGYSATRDISDLQKGLYIIELMNDGVSVGKMKMIKK